jgi:hypothetical protein
VDDMAAGLLASAKRRSAIKKTPFLHFRGVDNKKEYLFSKATTRLLLINSSSGTYRRTDGGYDDKWCVSSSYSIWKGSYSSPARESKIVLPIAQSTWCAAKETDHTHTTR